MREEEIKAKIIDMEDRMIQQIRVIFAGDLGKEILYITKYQQAVQSMFTLMHNDLGIEETHKIIEMYIAFNKEINKLASKVFTH